MTGSTHLDGKSLELTQLYRDTRKVTVSICEPLEKEDYVVQPISFVSPPKWHLGHTTWFFEQFILVAYLPDYKVYNSQYGYVFNSYYETSGSRVVRTDRGNLSRPTVADIYAYRKHVDTAMEKLLHNDTLSGRLSYLLQVGINHEQQHQELLLSDIKYILGNNPLLPAYGPYIEHRSELATDWIQIDEGVYDVGYDGDGFCYDNELGKHKTYLSKAAIASSLVTNAEYLIFMQSGGYRSHQYWHSEGWEWVKSQNISAPMYWYQIDGQWMYYTLQGLKPMDPEAAVCHVSYYEAYAYAEWAGRRLPTEQEWEITQSRFKWGARWEWTSSSYLPYPGYQRESGALGEYNGKFMVGQQVLRGASVATATGHSRPTYRNFFHPDLRWQYTGIRLATDHHNSETP